jgi:hypothetical protein
MKGRLQGWIDRVFQLEEINGQRGCPAYLRRRTLARIGWLGIYLHHFVADDWARDFHDHPKRFISIGLRGRYLEETPSGSRVFKAPWVRSFPATHAHRIRMINGGRCWTLVIVLKAVRKWGFLTREGWVPWRRYTADKSAGGNCP